MKKSKKQVIQETVLKPIKEHRPGNLRRGSKKFSFSELSMFLNCPKQWELGYLEKRNTFKPSIHTCFGTAFHETLQDWVKTLLEQSAKRAVEVDLSEVLFNKIKEVYTEEKEKHGHFSTPEELQVFHEQGTAILEYIKKYRTSFFNTSRHYLGGIETKLQVEVKPNIYFKGYVDLIIYDEYGEEWLIFDIKTSRNGWNDYQKKDNVKTSQLILYKYFFSKQFNIPLDLIKVKYFIVKREVNEEAEFANMRRRVQEFIPPAGKIKINKSLEYVEKFLTSVIDTEGNYIPNQQPTPSLNSCRFCEFNGTFCTLGIKS